jgi:hypothetical protein
VEGMYATVWQAACRGGSRPWPLQWQAAAGEPEVEDRAPGLRLWALMEMESGSGEGCNSHQRLRQAVNLKVTRTRRRFKFKTDAMKK